MTKFSVFVSAVKERINEMAMSRSTKAQSWSYSRVFTAAEMESNNDKKNAHDATREGWEATATAAGYKVGARTAEPTEAITPLWRDAAGNWTEVNEAGATAEGFKITISGPTG